MEEGQAHLTMEAKPRVQTVQNHVGSVQTQKESVQHKMRGGYIRSIQDDVQTVQDQAPSRTHGSSYGFEKRRPCNCYMEAHQGCLSDQCSVRKHKLVLHMIYPRFCEYSKTLAHMTGHVVHVPCVLSFAFHFAHISCVISLAFTAHQPIKGKAISCILQD